MKLLSYFKSATGKAALGIVAIFLIVVFTNLVMRNTALGSARLDLTEEKAYTLSDSTKSILKDLDPETPVLIRYYATRDGSLVTREVELFMKKVDNYISEYKSLAPKGALKIEYLDPKPDTDAEDSANLDGIQGFSAELGGQTENLYFGLAISCIDQTVTVQLADIIQQPGAASYRERVFENDLTSAIAEVSRTDKVKIGLMTGLPSIMGSQPTQPGQPAAPAWVLFQQLQRNYEVEDLSMTPEAINPEEITALLVVHPAEISPAAEFAIDQYVLHGGTVIALVDAHTLFNPEAQQQNPMFGGAGGTATSTLPTLFEKWGITYESQVLYDAGNAFAMQPGVHNPVLVNTREDDIVNRDEILTETATDLLFVMSGGFSANTVEGLNFEPLIHSSNETALIDSYAAMQTLQGGRSAIQRLSYQTQRKLGDKQYTLAARLSGKFNTAFPEGDPNQPAPAEGEDATPAEDTALKTATKAANVFLFADVDFLNDQAAFNVQNILGQQVAIPMNSNSGFFFNIIDQATGSKALIGARTKATTRRPFTLVEKIERGFNQQAGEKILALQDKEQEAISRIQAIESEQQQGQSFYLSSASQAELDKLREEQVEASKGIRELQKDLQKEKDKLAASVMNWTIIPMVLLVLAAGIAVAILRNKKSSAQ